VVIDFKIIRVEGLPIHSSPHGGALEQVNLPVRLFYPLKTGFRVLAPQDGVFSFIVVAGHALEVVGDRLGGARSRGRILDLPVDKNLLAPGREVPPGIGLATFEDEPLNTILMFPTRSPTHEKVHTG